MNKKNLLKLAAFLEKLPQAKFDMLSYRLTKGMTATNFYSLDNCGTIGCAMGYAPFVKGLEVEEEDFYKSALDFNNYCRRIFRIDIDYCGKKSRWKFIFSYQWRNADNTPQGAAKRIRYLVKNPKLKKWDGEVDKEAVELYQ